MLKYIKANYKAGDSIEITTSEGGMIGEIEYVTDKFIILRQPNGQICGIAASDVRTFTAQTPEPVVPTGKPVTAPPADEDYDNTADENEATQNRENHTENGEEADQTLINESLAAVSEPKVVGHIDLDRLQRIDPRFSRRRYFRHDNEEGETDEEDENAENDAQADGNMYRRNAYVGAKGRITYYNNERRYGFIQDYKSEDSLYFHIQQVADPRLYDYLRKGTKVVYTTDRNAQGFVARCVHLPKSFDDVLMLANDEYDARHFNTARDLVNHLLEIDPEYKPAKDLLDEINDAAPSRFTPFAQQQQFHSASQYMPNTLYARAKRAFLDKDNRKAEELYKQAIEAGEKVETCVKDLVTLYVSEYKQQEEGEAKEAARQKAVEFLNGHRDLLPDNLTNKQFLALNYYLPILDLHKFIELVDEIMADPQVSKILSRRVFYIWQKAIAYNKMNRVDEALDLIEEGLTLSPYNRQLANLKNQILNPEINGRAEEAMPALPASDETASSTPEAASPEDAAPEAASPEDAAAETAAAPADNNSGNPQPDSWWDDLKNQPV